MSVEKLSKDEVLKVLENSLGTSDFTMEEYLIRPASENPMGFLGDHMRIKANVTVKGQAKELFYFVKKIPTEVPSHLEYALKTRAFYKEIEMYKTLFDDFNKAQKDHKKHTKWFPDYYYSRGYDIFVVEDLSVCGYYMYPERTLMDMEHIKAGIRALAAMHSDSFVFEDRFNRGEIGTKSATFSEKDRKKGKKVAIGEVYSHIIFESEATDEVGHPGNTYYEAGIRSQMSIVDLLPDYTPEEKIKIKEALPNTLRKMTTYWVKPIHKFKNVMIHGDLWSNNLMFKKNEKGEVDSAVMVDFQLARYAPPAHDIVTFLHFVQNNDYRLQHEAELCKYYYDTLGQELAKNDVDVKKVFAWEDFLESYHFFDEFGAISSVLYFQLILTPSEITSKFLASPELFDKNMLVSRSEMIVECYLHDEICRSRMTQAMNYLIKNYIPI